MKRLARVVKSKRKNAKKTYPRLFGTAVFDQYESFELAEGFEELGDLVVGEEGGDVGDADFVGGIGDGGGDDAFHGFELLVRSGGDDVVLWSTHGEACWRAVGGAVFEFDVIGFVHAEAIESEGDGGIGGGFELDQGERSVFGDLAGDAGVNAFDHVEAVELEVEEVYYAFVCGGGGEIVNEEALRLSGIGRLEGSVAC